MTSLTVVITALGLAAGWSDGVLGAAFLGVVAVGAGVRVLLEPIEKP